MPLIMVTHEMHFARKVGDPQALLAQLQTAEFTNLIRAAEAVG